MVEVIEIRIPSKPKFLKIIRAGMNHICETMGFSQEESNNITLAVDEACSNIIKHAYGGSTNKPIHVKCVLSEDRLEVILRDFGKKADESEIKSRELDDVRPGGLGVHLIKSVMDIVRYDNSYEQGNQLQLVKYVRRKS
ncbi:MAG: ATP-binding protein [bacterium]|nr:MAG: ATP-binding protein [bacterium]